MPGVLYHSPQRIIGTYLISQGYGIDPNAYNGTGDIPNGDWPIYDGRTPDLPDDVIGISGTAGRSFGYTQVDSERQEMYGIQVMCRGYDESRTYLKCMELSIALDRIIRVFLTLADNEISGTGTGGVQYCIESVARTTEVISVGRDTPQGKRVVYTTNALASIRLCGLS